MPIYCSTIELQNFLKDLKLEPILINVIISNEVIILLSMEPWRLRPKKFQTSVAVPAAPVRVPSQRPLAPSFASVMSVANDKDDMKWSWGLCTDLLAFALQPRKTRGGQLE